MVFVVLRIVYIPLYIGNQDKLRSLVFLVGFGICIYLFYLALTTKLTRPYTNQSGWRQPRIRRTVGARCATMKPYYLSDRECTMSEQDQQSYRGKNVAGAE